MPTEQVIATESRHPATATIDAWESPIVVERLIQIQLDACGRALALAVPALSAAVLAAAERLGNRQSRLIYIGAGTSGRLAEADAAELYPTFGFPPSRTVVIRPKVNEDDDYSIADSPRFAATDVVLAIAASGTTNFTVTAVREAIAAEALTIGFINNEATLLGNDVDVEVLLATGAEPITGSTRMAAGLAQKLALTTFSTAVMIALGRTLHNEMVHMQPTVAKLSLRSLRIITELTGLEADEAASALRRSDSQVATAVISQLAGLDPQSARDVLEHHDSDMRAVAIALGLTFA